MEMMMGLDTSHGAWHGAYSAFMRWREKIAEVAELPPLMAMEGFWTPDHNTVRMVQMALARQEDAGSFAGSALGAVERDVLKFLPISWGALKPDPLHILLSHSDCDGEIAPEDCAAIADRLDEILFDLPDEDVGGHIGNWRLKTREFIAGCRAASAANEPLDFH